jgi:hypothetical protein
MNTLIGVIHAAQMEIDPERISPMILTVKHFEPPGSMKQYG